MKQYPGWLTNLFVFAVTIVLVGSYFFWQVRQASREFQDYLQQHSGALAAVVELNIRNALLSKTGLEDIISNSLENSARFLYFLDSTEPFSSGELTAFAVESGFVGVKIMQADNGSVVTGPADWLPGLECPGHIGLQHLADKKLYLFSFYESESHSNISRSRCVLIGVSAEEIDATLEKISVKRLLSMLNNFHDIAYVRLVSGDGMSTSVNSSQDNVSSESLIETAIPIGDKQLIVALKTDRYSNRIAQMQREFVVFITLLVIFGSLSSWWLYRIQRKNLQQTRDFERKIARQHEDAALGRAAATITHELRNPLNAIGMGLQRLQIETVDLEPEHDGLIISMRDAVTRTNTIIERLRQYAHSFEVVRQPVDMENLVYQVLVLYQRQCEEQRIRVELECEADISILGDKDLLGQLFENLLKNSVEAQPHGGFLKISIRRFKDVCNVSIVNGGFFLSEEESQLLFEPYFTSKSKGTGLGLVISRKIAQVHNGYLEWDVDFENESIEFLLNLPLGSSGLFSDQNKLK